MNGNPIDQLMEALRISHIRANDYSKTIQELKQYDGRPRLWETIQFQLDMERRIQDEIRIKLTQQGLRVRIFRAE